MTGRLAFPVSIDFATERRVAVVTLVSSDFLGTQHSCWYRLKAPTSGAAVTAARFCASSSFECRLDRTVPFKECDQQGKGGSSFASTFH